jgi:lipopolysaccharide/colanic/teichoic acid biosynthesis glycosyltransferase
LVAALGPDEESSDLIYVTFVEEQASGEFCKSRNGSEMARVPGFDSGASISSAGPARTSAATSEAVVRRPAAGDVRSFPFRVAGTASPDLEWFLGENPGRPIVRGEAYGVAKRILDVATVVLALPLAIPVFLVCWLAVKIEAPRAPAVFVQSRTGRNGRRFRMFKFRTMVPDAEEKKAGLESLNKLSWPDFKVEDDPRITRLGVWLRKTSLDELPQLINVLRGEMSLVGPRPTSFGVETYREWQKARLTVPPGLTGLWQIAGRGEMEFDERVRLDLAYIARRSLALDARILLRTFGAVIRRKGAC